MKKIVHIIKLCCILFFMCIVCMGICACTSGNDSKDGNTVTCTDNEILDSTSGNYANLDIQTLDISREIENYIATFIQLYTSTVIEDEDIEAALVIEERKFSADNGNEVTIIKYSDLSGASLRYELHYYGETGNRTVNYYLCENFYWISNQMNYYSSWVLDPDNNNILYSQVDHWIVMDETVYSMYDSGKLEKIQEVPSEILLLQDVESYWEDAGNQPMLDENEEDVIYFSLLDGTTLQIDKDRFKALHTANLKILYQ